MYNSPEYFLGSWIISRLCYTKTSSNLLNDQTDNAYFEGKGKAKFEKAENDNLENSGYTTLKYNEALTLNHSIAKGSDKQQAKQEYQYVFDKGNVSKHNKSDPLKPNSFSKMFDLNYQYPANDEEDYPDFIEYEIVDAYAEGSYKCGNDNYLCKIYFKSENEFKITYEVSGPEKDYVIISEFKKTQPEDSTIELFGNMGLLQDASFW